MSLRDDNLRYAALKLVADMVADAMKDEKAAHLEALTDSQQDSGSTQWSVEVDGVKVATVSLSRRAGAPRIVDEDALIEFLEETRPDMIETVKRLKPWAEKEVLSTVEFTEAGAVNRDGEIVPGVEESEPGNPYQSLRWNSKADGKAVVADAIRRGDLAEVLAGTDLPMLGDQP